MVSALASHVNGPGSIPVPGQVPMWDFSNLGELLSHIVSAPRHYKGRVGALHVYIPLDTLSVWCSLKLPVYARIRPITRTLKIPDT